MPKIGKKKYPYTKEGMKKWAYAANVVQTDAKQGTGASCTSRHLAPGIFRHLGPTGARQDGLAAMAQGP